LDDSEEFCKSYDPAIKCFSQKLPLFCKKWDWLPMAYIYKHSMEKYYSITSI
jgi:hypothetical protein